MSIGYACLTIGVLGTKLKSCTIKNASPEVLFSLIQSNLKALDNIFDYNLQNGIKLFRISSDIIPFGSHPVNRLKWWEIFKNQLKELGNKALLNGMRLSMHPGQYTVLNSPDQAVVGRAVEDLRYHARFLDAMGLGQEHKLILHIGGVYRDKMSAIKGFIHNYRCLEANIRQRLVIENDDRQYTIADVLSIGERESIPVVFDNLHHQVNPDNTYSELEWITACGRTWRESDGSQKLHYSQQAADKRAGSHSATLDVEAFARFYQAIPNHKVDIMLEVKDKNLSAVKCINATSSPEIQRLEREWSRYQYLVLEHSPTIYQELRDLLTDKSAYPAIEFYKLIDKAILTPVKPINAVNAAWQVWDYFQTSADVKTRLKFEKSIAKVVLGESTIPMKRLLWKLTGEQKQKTLLDSLYFMELI